MRTLYIDGFFVFGLALTTVPVVGPSSPRFSMPLISVRTFIRVSATMILGRQPSGKAPFAAAIGFRPGIQRPAHIRLRSVRRSVGIGNRALSSLAERQAVIRIDNISAAWLTTYS